MATLGTRADIRKSIRNKIQCWPDVTTLLSAPCYLADTTMALSAAALPYISDKCLIEAIDYSGEVMQAMGIANPVTSPIPIMRSVHGSPAAADHFDSVQVFPSWGWTDDSLNSYITRALYWLGQSMVWTLKPYVNTWKSGYKEFGLPAGVIYPTGDIVKKVEILDPVTGAYKQMLGWTHQGDRIILNDRLFQDYTVRIWVQTLQGVLTDDVTRIDTPYAQEAIEMYAAGRVLDELIGNRSRYYDYSAALNDRASTLDELQRASYYMFNQATILVDKISRPGLAGYAPIQRP